MKTQTKKQGRAARNTPTAYQIALARRFVEHLGTGRQNAKTGKALAEEMQTNTRQIQQYAETARRIGYPVIANSERCPRGYFIAQNPEEVKDYTGRLHHRAGEIHKTRAELILHLSHWDFETQQHDFEIDPEEVNPA